MVIFRTVLGAAFVLTTCAGGLAALPPAAGEFITKNCVECHDAESKKGGLDFSALQFDLLTSKSFDAWVKVCDRVRDGEMPPKKVKVRPEKPAIDAFLATIAAPMVQADRDRAMAEGRSTLRRLNRYEYENAIRDLLHAPWLQIKDMLPEDEESHRYNKSGEALSVSHVHMSSYLAVAEYALRQSIATQEQRPKTTTRKYYVREQASFVGKVKFNEFNRSPERAVFPMLGTTAQPDVIAGTAPVTVGAADPEVREKEAFGLVCSAYEPIEPRFDQFKAPIGGRYRLRLNGYTFWAGPGPEKKWWTPDRNKTFPGRRGEPVTLYAYSPPRQLRLLGSVDFSIEPSVQEMDVWLLPGESIRPDASRLFRSRPPSWHNPLATKEGAPGVAYRWLEVEGPLLDQWPSAGHKMLFGDLPIKAGTSGAEVEIVPANSHADAERLLSTFMTAAYRRPVPNAEVQRFLGVINYALKSGAPFVDAMVAGYSAVLCSPDFVCLEEKPGRLDDFALASRLAFFLWNSPPDDELRGLAARGELHKPQVLRAQSDRLLADARSRRFVDAFLDYWLDLRKINATAPDASLYNDYYLDDLLADSADQETRMFFAELLAKNLPVSNIVASDFTMLNERLATHYGIPGVTGVALRKVNLAQDSVRGGLMTQASVLKVTANGTTTSPVLRGVWVMERILGKPPAPPPPSVPAIDPDTRGAVTIRAQLEKHRTQQSCAACHAKIDPAGFALENFDVMGGWRSHYRGVAETAAAGSTSLALKGPPAIPGFGHNGQPFAFHTGPIVDASGDLPDGRHFQDVRSLKKLFLDDPRQIARNLVSQLVVYGTGTPVRFGDRPDVERILDHAAGSQFCVRDLIDQIVQSDLFQTK